jgi:hypothetical protein
VSRTSINAATLLETAVEYLNHPEVRCTELDWVLLDAMVFHELQSQGADMRTYLTLATLIGRLKSLSVYLLLPAVVYLLFTREHTTLGTVAGMIGSIVLVIHLVGAPFRSQDLERGRTVLRRLQDLYALIGNRNCSPIELRASLDKVVAAGVVLDRAVFTLVDSVCAKDSAAVTAGESGAASLAM